MSKMKLKSVICKVTVQLRKAWRDIVEANTFCHSNPNIDWLQIQEQTTRHDKLSEQHVSIDDHQTIHFLTTWSVITKSDLVFQSPEKLPALFTNVPRWLAKRSVARHWDAWISRMRLGTEIPEAVICHLLLTIGLVPIDLVNKDYYIVGPKWISVLFAIKIVTSAETSSSQIYRTSYQVFST